MLTRGEYSSSDGTFGVICYNTKEESEIILVYGGNVWSSYKVDYQGEFSFGNKKAKELWNILKKGIKGCTAKNGVAAPFQLGTVSRHRFTKTKVDHLIDKFNNELAGAEISGEGIYLQLEYYPDESIRPANIPYIKLTVAQEFGEGISEEEAIQVRTLEEISLEKDVEWLKNKKYYIVNDDEVAEKLFSYIERFNGPIAYDTETTGLRINMFSKINSKYQKSLNEYNATREEKDKIRSDRLVGIIFCVEPEVSYYFPCFNRKFKNLYEDKSSETRRRVIQNIKAKYTIGKLRDADTDMARYFRETPEDELGCDSIMMERCRDILENGHLVAHNGAFEWKVSWCYDIAINLKDDTMIMHQLMYKFRSTTANRGEPSSLKYLTKCEFGIDQLELSDFFVDFKEDNSGEVRSGGKKKGPKKKSSKIDFSYMDYNGTVAYAPADGDTTLALYFKYKRDMIENHNEMEYIYSVEVVVAMAVGYMEFYGHRLDEEKINRVRDSNRQRMLEIEHEIRLLAKASDPVEIKAFADLSAIKEEIEAIDLEIDKLKGSLGENESSPELENKKASRQELFDKREAQIQVCREAIASASDEINLASPAKVAKLFFERMEIPFSGEKMSVAKKEIKPLLKMKNEEGKDKYPVVHLYSEWKKLDTLLTKFFDNLQYFMYPGGFIFSSYGQISTATGRMSCSKPNAQQYPKDVTGIVIPRENYVLFDADYSQIEYRTLVAMANEPFLAELFKDPDNDYHTLMASLMYGVPYASVTPKMRGDAKSFNFGIPYGMGFKSLAILLTGMSGPSQVEEAKEKYELYFKDQPNVRKFFDQVKEMALVNRYTKTYWKRYRYYSFTDKDGNASNSRKAMALRQAGNAVIQGTAADIFKISVARNFMYIKEQNLLGQILIINMVHDEQLMEFNCDTINTQRALKDIVNNMEFKVPGFPPLYVGAGFGANWKEAKGKMAEIHPYLAEQLSAEADKMSIKSDYPASKKQVLEYFNDRVNSFRFNKVRDYVLNPENFGKDLHPAIGNLINLQFTYGLEKTLDGDELTLASLAKFIEVNNIGVDPNNFKAIVEQTVELEEDTEYEDEDEDEELTETELYDNDFALVDEEDKLYGVSLQELIKEFGLIVSKDRKVCGIDITIMPYKSKDDMVEYLAEHKADEFEEGAMQVVFLQESNVLFNTGVWVKNIDGSSMSARLRLNTLTYR